ncbi:hypothetical protein SETIT_7G041800v2 [Setaria italica]|uniref:Uncharacterized protein n=1 Tax=Setaria italica TaxID=4555 RepID=A0A368RS07_SETIT|nr:hypothetical protein SETIT_7G041800v2 [Setaria italica]
MCLSAHYSLGALLTNGIPSEWGLSHGLPPHLLPADNLLQVIQR